MIDFRDYNNYWEEFLGKKTKKFLDVLVRIIGIIIIVYEIAAYFMHFSYSMIRSGSAVYLIFTPILITIFIVLIRKGLQKLFAFFINNRNLIYSICLYITSIIAIIIIVLVLWYTYTEAINVYDQYYDREEIEWILEGQPRGVPGRFL